MIHFNSDYTEGAHENVLKRLIETNLVQTPGYGEDEFCEEAKALIKKACSAPDASVHFLVGGTQTNVTVIDFMLKPYQGAVAATSGHINVHETGALEHTGHKVLPIPSPDGKIKAEEIDSLVKNHWADGAHEHIAQPGLVYISQPTELGTMYTLEELTKISNVCKDQGLYLFVDGARLGYGLMSKGNDVTLKDLARLADVFYVGGTKVGALFGEAVVFKNEEIAKNFRYSIKQNGGMLAKGRLLGIQFAELFKNDLYFEIAKHAIVLADEIRAVLTEKQIPFLVENDTNQIFPIFEDSDLEKLSEKYVFSYQERVDETHSAVRICTSWATKRENVESLKNDLRGL